MGNSTGSLDLQWDAIYSYVQLQGGFIWDWVDQGLYDKERVWTYGGDYGKDTPSDANFLCNGIVNPDREPHPGFWEVKHVYQDITVRKTDDGFEAFNRNYFKSLDGTGIRWWVERNGKRIKRGKAKLTAAPQSAEPLKVRLPRMKKPGEYRIFFESFDLKNKADIIAADEILLGIVSCKKSASKASSLSFRAKSRNLTVTDGDTRIVMRGKKTELVFDKVSGNILSYKYKGKDVVNADFGIRPNFWRAPNDNDYGAGLPFLLKDWADAVKSVTTKAENGSITALYQLPDNASLKVVYTLNENGTLNVESRFTGGGKGQILPRLGFRFHTPADEFSYFGRGPVENYWDRNSCTFKRIWKSSASEEFYPYVRPQETGHHTETSWLKIGKLTVSSCHSDRSGGISSFEFSALRQSIEDLSAKQYMHLGDVPTRDFTEVCIDYGMTGVGGYDSWGAVPEPSRSLFTNQSYSWSFTLTP